MSRAWGIRDCFGDTEGVGVLSEVGIRGVNWRVCGDACMVAALGRLRFFRHGRDALNSMCAASGRGHCAAGRGAYSSHSQPTIPGELDASIARFRLVG